MWWRTRDVCSLYSWETMDRSNRCRCRRWSWFVGSVESRGRETARCKRCVGEGAESNSSAQLPPFLQRNKLAISRGQSTELKHRKERGEMIPQQLVVFDVIVLDDHTSLPLICTHKPLVSRSRGQPSRSRAVLPATPDTLNPATSGTVLLCVCGVRVRVRVRTTVYRRTRSDVSFPKATPSHPFYHHPRL